jgi:DNA-binding LytR/AlgR family response regulator
LIFFTEHGKKAPEPRRSARQYVSLLLRCAYIVNLDQVLQLSGNAQGLRLHLKGIDTTIPVSRTLNNEIRARLNA